MAQSLKKQKSKEEPYERKFYMRHQAPSKPDEDKENKQGQNKPQ